MLHCCRARGREGEEVFGIAVWINQSDFAKRTGALKYHKPSNADPCGQPQQGAGWVTAGTAWIMLCNGMPVVSSVRQRFSMAHFHGGLKFVMFPWRAGAQDWSFAVLPCQPPDSQAGDWDVCQDIPWTKQCCMVRNSRGNSLLIPAGRHLLFQAPGTALTS